MKVKKMFDFTHKEEPLQYFDFENYKKNIILYLGDIFSSKLKTRKKERYKEVALQIEEPNRFFVIKKIEKENFYKIFTICPYTTRWLNKIQNINKRETVFFPFNGKLTPKENKKEYDIIYSGHLLGKEIETSLESLKKFNLFVLSNTKYEFFTKISRKFKIIPMNISEKIDSWIFKKKRNLITKSGGTYEEKLDLISKSKITLVHNLLFPTKKHLKNLRKIPLIEKNEAFKVVFSKSKNKIVPQIKTRLFDAAFCRSLILCRKDPWNVIENYFEEGKEFIYYTNIEDLKEKVRDIVNNYEKYEKIIENAFKRAKRDYTTKRFFEKYLRKL